MNNDNLLFGKSGLKRVVGLECSNDQSEIFVQDESGNVSSIFKPHAYWILCDEKFHSDCKELSGNLHYKWAKRFHNKKEFQLNKVMLKNAGRDTYSIANPEEACMVKDGITFYRDMQPKDLSLLSFDIETTGLDGNAADAKVLLISTTFRDYTGVMVNKLFSYDDFSNEATMIYHFCQYVREMNPSLIIGHNIISYDFPYLKARANQYGVPLSLGRDGSTIEFNSYTSKFRLDGTRNLEYNNVKIYGREIVDTYFLAVSFDVSKSIDSYSLKPMIKQLGFEKEDRQYYDAGSIRDNYKNPVEWEKIKQYAIEDAEDPVKLWDYMGPLYFNMCPYMAKPLSEMLLSASGSKINGMMVRAYLQDAHSIPKADTMEKFEGALSFAVPGLYKNCFKIDLAALYPSIMIQYGVYDEDKDPKGYLLQLVKIFRAKRLEYKRLAAETNEPIWKEMDTTAKSILNSFYGFMGASGLQFNSLACAAFITQKGREILEYTIKWASGEDLDKFVDPSIEWCDACQEEHGGMC